VRGKTAFRAVLLCVAAYLICLVVIELLMTSGRTQAANGMHAISASLDSGDYAMAVKLKVLTPEASEQLLAMDQKRGKLETHRWKVKMCQISGTPCILQIDGVRRKKPHRFWMTFHGRRCDSVYE
jgi:hypothetical protein